MFDLLIKGGHVIDRSAGYEGKLDVAIAAGRVAAVDGGIPMESARRTVAAAGQYVTPGLIDLHTHVFRDFTYWGVNAEQIGPSTGVTTWVDAGSAGGITLPAFREFIVRPSSVRILAFLNIAYVGLVAPDFELQVPEFCDVELFKRTCTANRDIVVGGKVRMGNPTVGDNGVEPMRQARRAADRCDVPVMLHIADGPPDIDEVLGFLRPGDIITHCFTGATMKLVDDEGRLLDAARRVIDSGVMLDVGHGAGGLSCATAERLVASGLARHVISTDLHQMSIHGPAVISSDAGASPFIRLRREGQHSFDLPTCLTKFLCLGMTLADVIEAATARPAELIGRAGQLGTLKPGVVADAATFELVPGRFEFADMYGETKTGKEVLRNVHTFIAGREVEGRAARTVAPWVDTVEERD